MMRMRESTDSARAISTICCCPSRRSSTSVIGSISSSRSPIRASAWRASSAKSMPVAAAQFAPHEDVVAHAQVGREAELLVDDRDAMVPRVRGGGEGGTALPSSSIDPGGRRHDAGQDLHQCRFAGPVLAEQCRDFAAADIEVHALEGIDTAISTWRCCAPTARRRRSPAAGAVSRTAAITSDLQRDGGDESTSIWDRSSWKAPTTATVLPVRLPAVESSPRPASSSPCSAPSRRSGTDFFTGAAATGTGGDFATGTAGPITSASTTLAGGVSGCGATMTNAIGVWHLGQGLTLPPPEPV